MISSLVVGVWMARYLGPENFGTLNYVISFTSLFFSVATLGLDSIIVHNLIKAPLNEKTTLGTIFILQVLGGIIAYFTLIFSIFLTNPYQGLVKKMVIVYGIILVLKSFEVFKYCFESKLQSKLTVWVENIVYFIFVAVKIVCILKGISLFNLVFVLLAEVVFSSIGLGLIYIKKIGSIKLWKFNFRHGKFYLKESWPFIISGIAVVVYTRIDAVMLGQMLGNKSVGIYSVALRISEIWYFIPMIIVASAYPLILESRKISEYFFINKFQKLLNVLFLIALILAVGTSIFAPYIIYILFGINYIESANVLILQTWSGLFVFLGVAGGRWFLAENLQKLLIYRTFLGAITNLGLNFILIPRYGILGAAWATLISQAMANVFSNFIGKKSRKLFFMQIKSMYWYFKLKHE